MTEPSDKPETPRGAPEVSLDKPETPTGGYAPSPGYGAYPPPPGNYPPSGYPQQPGYYPQPGYSPQGNPYGYEPPAATKKNGLGTAALVVAVIALLLFWTVVGGMLLGTVAVVLGFIGMARAKRGEADNRGIAIAGVVLGFVAVLVSAVFITIGAVYFWNSGFDSYYDCVQSAGQDEQKISQCVDEFSDTVESNLSITLDPPTP